MRIYLISDNTDTQIGLRFAGIDGCVVNEKNDFLKCFNIAISNDDIAILLITEKLITNFGQYINLKLEKLLPLISIIPDRHGSKKDQDYITKYIKEAIGVKI